MDGRGDGDSQGVALAAPYGHSLVEPRPFDIVQLGAAKEVGDLAGHVEGDRQLPDRLVIASRTAMGTSTLALDLLRCATLKHNLPAALFALESRRIDITLRLLSAEARVPMHHMRSGTMSDDDWVRLARRMPEVSEAPLYLQDDPCSSFTELRARARRLHRLNDLKLIAVDDVQQLHYGTRPLGSRYEEVSEIARGLKHLAKELEIPVVAVSTLNRAPEQRTDKLPQINDLRDSGALEDNAASSSCTARTLTRRTHPAPAKPTSSSPSTATAPPPRSLSPIRACMGASSTWHATDPCADCAPGGTRTRRPAGRPVRMSAPARARGPGSRGADRR
ncbi:hypothetical protein GCM10010345_90740 [Streptomyces canarius]|uniref:SF4 helicase domain-containing protein n=1 Tax=Streptomyces canarius TaxID=285453 RepID=A0ABQ3DCI7_9ACTN|nr:hypothetical protein GCM10010345_90740 [Streptomyces canarius]